MLSSTLAWHGCRADGTTKHLKVKELVGVKNVLTGDIVLCENALHGSIRAVDMLRQSEGLWIKRTLHEGIIAIQPDKIGSSERTVVAEADATQLIKDWAFWCADRAVHVYATAALRSVGMNEEADKLAGLKAITNKKSAHDAHAVTYAVYTHIYSAAAYGDSGAGHAIYSAAGYAAAAVYAAATSNRAADANEAFVNTAHATHAVTCAANAMVVPHIAETAFLNDELESRLFALMGITKTEIKK